MEWKIFSPKVKLTKTTEVSERENLINVDECRNPSAVVKTSPATREYTQGEACNVLMEN